MRPIARAAAPLALVALVAACGLPDPEPLPRVVGASPEGADAAVDGSPEVRFSAPADPVGLLDGARLVLVPAASLREAAAAVESEGGAAALGAAVPVERRLADGGARVVLRPAAPLRGWSTYALVLSSLARAADGRSFLDPEGRRRTFVATFATGAPAGPPPRPVLTEVRADAATPEAGGEYAEVANLGEGPLDLTGWRLAKRTTAGTLTSCAIDTTGASPLPAGEVAIVGGGAWDGRYALPPGVAVLTCGATALLGGIANDRPPELALLDPQGTVRATLGAAGAPSCPAALEMIDPAGEDVPANLACSAGEGTPGLLPAP